MVMVSLVTMVEQVLAKHDCSISKKSVTQVSPSPLTGHLIEDYCSYGHNFKAGSFTANAYVVKIYDFQILTFIYSSLTSLFIYELTKTHCRGSWAHIQCKADFYDTAYYIII